MLTMVLKERTGMPQEYRLIPVSVIAIQVTPETFERALEFAGGVPVTEIDAIDSKKRFVAMNIPTLMGTVRAGEGDWIVKEPRKQLQIMNDVEFRSKYEKV